MTRIKYGFKEQGEYTEFSLICTEHCSHDVCVSISALISTIVQNVRYGEMIGSLSESPDIKYEFGNVQICAKIKNTEKGKKISERIKGLILGIKMYRENFPTEIKLCGVN